MSDCVLFIPGINPTRAEKQFLGDKIEYYDQAAFENDYTHKSDFLDDETREIITSSLALKQGDVIISNSMSLATMVGKNNAGKIPSLNFIKVEFPNNHIDRYYFIYLFNAYKDVKRQKERELQGSSTILRIPVKALNELIIPIIPLEEQKKIGIIYRETLVLQSKLNKYANTLVQFADAILDENLREKR